MTIKDISVNNLESFYQNMVKENYVGGDSSVQHMFMNIGELSPANIEHLLKVIEVGILDSGSKRRTMKRIYSVLIEVFQNMVIHGAKNPEGKSKSLIHVAYNESDFIVTTGNLVLKEDASVLSNRIDELNDLDKKDLRKLYIETLCNDSFSSKGGAGLGFLTIAKKANDKLDYQLISTSKDCSYFIFQMKFER